MMQNVKTLIAMFRQLFYILNGKQRRRSVLLLLLFLVTALLETLGVSAVIPFIIALMSPESLMQYPIVQKVTAWFGVGNTKGLLLLIAALVVVVYVIKDGMILAANYYQLRFRNEMERDLSTLMLRSYLNRDYMYFVETNSSDMMRGVSGDISNVAQVIDSFSTLFAETLTCMLLGAFLIYLDPLFALGLLLLALVTALIMILAFKKKNAECGRQCREAFSKRYQYIYQPISGYKEISVSQRKQYFIDQFQKEADKACRFNTQYLFICKLPNRVIETVFISGLVVLVCIMVVFGNSEATEQFVTVLGAVAVAAVRILPAISNITASMNGLVYNRLSLEEAYQNISLARAREAELAGKEKRAEMGSGEPQGDQKQEAESLRQGDTGKTAECGFFQSELTVRSVWWKYPEGERNVLEDASLTIHKGEAVALIGESGAGKTTLADIILGLLHPQKGEVLLDGTDIYSIPKRWAKTIGFVPQNVFLIDDTVRHNVAFGIYEDEIEDDKIIHALKSAQIYEFIQGLPHGLDTVVGEGGVKFSGGQRQRLAIARALYDNPDILVLDEATSALDNETESAVMQSIDALKGTKTLIIIAHRLSTIENCNKVYEVKDGKAVLREGKT
ncbi:MAG: ABC transporter ATP-binding protein/permease [Clostridium sp.]|nr:ABC transporter ATP-binding protein/permease [Clostridium sp.]